MHVVRPFISSENGGGIPRLSTPKGGLPLLALALVRGAHVPHYGAEKLREEKDDVDRASRDQRRRDRLGRRVVGNDGDEIGHLCPLLAAGPRRRTTGADGGDVNSGGCDVLKLGHDEVRRKEPDAVRGA